MSFRNLRSFKLKQIFTFLLLFSSFFISCVKSKEKKDAQSSSLEKLKILNVSRSADPRTLDPQAQFDQGSSMFISNVLRW